MEVKIGVQSVQRELTIDTTLDADGVEKAVAGALEEGGVLALTDSKGRHRRPGRQARLRRHLDERQRAGRLPLLTRT